MISKYYIATFDGRILDQWHLSAPIDRFGNKIRASKFTVGRECDGAAPAEVPIYQASKSLQVSFGDEKMVVVSAQAKTAILAVEARDCQFFKVRIPGIPEPWFLLNAIVLVDCFDEKRSVSERQEPTDGNAPHDVEYDMVAKLVIDPARVGDHDLFRVRGWDIDLIVSDRVKAALERLPSHGVLFKCVTP